MSLPVMWLRYTKGVHRADLEQSGDIRPRLAQALEEGVGIAVLGTVAFELW